MKIDLSNTGGEQPAFPGAGGYASESLAQTIDRARQAHFLAEGRCAMCAVGDKPHNGVHRGQYHCGNEDACVLCRGCMPVGEQCQACGRIAQA